MAEQVKVPVVEAPCEMEGERGVLLPPRCPLTSTHRQWHEHPIHHAYMHTIISKSKGKVNL